MLNPAMQSTFPLPRSLSLPLSLCSLQYYDPDIFPYMKDQKNFEQNVFNKTHKADSESPAVPRTRGPLLFLLPALQFFHWGRFSAQGPKQKVENLAPTSRRAVSSAPPSRLRRNFPFLLFPLFSSS